MGVQFDWEVGEDDNGWKAVAKTPRAARAPHHPRLLTAAGAMLLGAGIATGLMLRVRWAENTRRAALEQTIAAETAALRIGDRAAFLEYQVESDPWRAYQADRFGRYQTDVIATGEVLSLAVEYDRAQAVLLEQTGDQTFPTTWHYVYDDGWQHAPPPDPPEGEWEKLTSTHFQFIYPGGEREAAEQVAARLDGWWEAACQLTHCSRLNPRMQVYLTTDWRAATGWAVDNDQTLIVPALHLAEASGGGPLDPLVTREVIGLLSKRMAQQVVSVSNAGPRPSSDRPWLEEEVGIWLNHQLDPAAPPSHFMDSLAALYGLESIPPLIRMVRSQDDLVTSLEIVTRQEVTAALPIRWESYFTYRLRSEAWLLERGHYAEVNLLFRHSDSTSGVLGLPQDPTVDLASAEVVDLRPTRDLVYATVRFEAPPTTDEADALVIQIPFRLISGRWVHS